MEGIRFVVADLDAPTLLAATSDPQARVMLLLNSRAPDDELRNESCRSNMLHTAPSRAMLADAPAQYLMAKRWRRWFLVTGSTPGDKLLAEAYRRAAKGFGAEIVAEKQWSFKLGHARTDTGHVTLQSEIPALMQVRDHDVLVVADQANEFGDYLPGRTALPRPVAGTHELVTTAWSAVSEQWVATQLQARFEKLAGRRMNAVDYAAWVATRAVGEAAIRARSNDPSVISVQPRFHSLRLQGTGAELSLLGRADAPADPDRRATAPRLRVAPGGISAPRVRARYLGI
jgi:ABC transporter substrate binding protein (PQQ-dependent alcohol dehydrogenase system)